jgi:hypothetical protein
LVVAGLVAHGAQDRATPDRAKLVGLDRTEVEARIGASTENDELDCSAARRAPKP